MTDEHDTFYSSFVSIDYIICECGETFPAEDDLRDHLEKEHPHKRERKEYKCGVCNKIYPTEQECVEHYEYSHIEIKQEHNYVADPEAEDHEEQTDTVFNENDRQEMYEVSLDPQELVYEDGYCDIDHVAQVVDVKKQSKRTKNEGKKNSHARNIVCETCGRRYASNAALTYHQRVHTGERPYKCTMCPKAFTTSLFLKIHIRTHTGERPYECPHCPKAFSNKTALLRHDRVHTGVKPYVCPKCGKAFSQSNSMKLHVNTVHLKMPAPYKSKKRRMKEKIKQDSTLEIIQEEHQNRRIVKDAKECVKVIIKEEYMEGNVKEECTDGTAEEYVEGSVEEECVVGSMEEECVEGTIECEEGDDGRVRQYVIVKQDDMDVSEPSVVYFDDDEGVTYNLVYE